MKIYYFSGSILPSNAANAVHVMKMCQAFAREGQDVTLFARYGKKGPQAGIFKSYGVEQNFKLALVPKIPLPVIGGLLRILMYLICAMKRSAPDLFYGRDPIGLLLAGWLFPHAKIMFEPHIIPAAKMELWAYRKLPNLKNFVGFVSISDGLKQDLLTHINTLQDSDILVAHDGADIPDRSKAPKDMIWHGTRQFAVGYTGSLYAGKGIETIVATARLCPDMDFHVLGGNPDQIAQWETKSPGNVLYYGHIDHALLIHYLKRFDIVLAPYQRSIKIKSGLDIARWTSPMKLFEYMAAEKAIICSDLPVLREIIKNEYNGMLVDPDNPEEWKKTLENLKKDKQMREKIGKNAKNDIKKHYTWGVRAKNILKFYKNHQNAA